MDLKEGGKEEGKERGAELGDLVSTICMHVGRWVDVFDELSLSTKARSHRKTNIN